MKNHILILVVLLFGGCMIFPKKDRIIIPDQFNKINQVKLRTEGYFYSEDTITNYCKYLPKKPGLGPYLKDKDSKYEEKIVKAIVLYDSGCAYHSDGTLFSGIDRSGNTDDYCDQLETNNSWDLAKKDFELFITNRLDTRNNANIFEKGVYNLSENNIQIQIYQSGSETLQLMDYKGKILNDTTFVLTSKIHHNFNKRKELNDIYKFVPFEINQNAPCYILENKKKFGR